MNRILAIDDNPDNLITVTALLKLFIRDCEVITAFSGTEGIWKAKSEQPDIILLDIQMPGMDGFDVCKDLKENDETTHIPVIMLTAVRTDSKSRVKALEIGADAFLTKPIDESELAAQVKAMLRIKKAEDRLRNEKQDLEQIISLRVNDLSIANEQLRMEMEEREKAQAQIRLKTNALENSLNAFDIVDKDGIFIYVNKAYVDMWGYESADEIIGTSLTGHFHDPSALDRIIEVLKDQKECRLEFTARKKDGSTFEVLTYVRLTHDENGQEIYASSSIDISEQKAAEQTRKILEKQLRQAQKMEAVGALAGGIAHDFNNILSPIIGYAEILKEDINENSLQADSIQEIYSAALRAKKLVRQILTFSRTMDQEIKPVKIQHILKETLNLTQSIIPSTITIEKKIDTQCRPTSADPTQIHQMIMNLITNAYHAMQKTGGTLSIILSEITSHTELFKNKQMVPGTYLCLKVKDTGVGIEKDILHNIFDPYFTTKGVDKGTGLGLSVVQGIVKNANGEIFVESTPQKGTCFEIYLPVLKETKPEQFHTHPPLSRGREHILLVDDEDYIIRIETKMLERLGYQITSTTDSAQAFELFAARPDRFDILITDMTMPGMTGVELSKRVLEITPGFPIILCTGFSENMDESTARQIGIRALLMKPIILSDMAGAVRKVIDQKDQDL